MLPSSKQSWNYVLDINFLLDVIFVEIWTTFAKDWLLIWFVWYLRAKLGYELFFGLLSGLKMEFLKRGHSVGSLLCRQKWIYETRIQCVFSLRVQFHWKVFYNAGASGHSLLEQGSKSWGTQTLSNLYLRIVCIYWDYVVITIFAILQFIPYCFVYILYKHRLYV